MSIFLLLYTYCVTHPKYRVLFHAEYSGRQVRLTAYRHLMPRLTVRGAVRPPDLRVHGIVHHGQGNFNFTFSSTFIHGVDSSLNVMAHCDAREGK